MGHAIPVSDETYRALEAFARRKGASPEEFGEALLRECLRQLAGGARMRPRRGASHEHDLARAARGESARYSGIEAYFAVLGEAGDDGAGDTNATDQMTDPRED